MRLIIILIVVLWGSAALVAFALTLEKSRDARLTAGYFIAWPILAVALLLNEPVPMWVAVPVVFGFLPWFMSGPHLWAILKDPAQSRADEIIGIPRAYWKWGGIGSVLLGLLFNGYV